MVHDGHRERLRHTFTEHGAQAMQEHQLLELLLTFSIPRIDVNALAHSLINRYGSLTAVLSADAAELMQVQGVGERTAALITLVGALRVMPAKDVNKGNVIGCPADAGAFCRGLFANARYEAVYAVSLDKKRRVMHVDCIARGTLSETAVYPRLVVECALRHCANSVILAHNHPSGSVNPSAEDIDATKAVLAALSAIGITLHDHIIVGGDSSYSMVSGSIISTGEVKDTVPLAAE